MLYNNGNQFNQIYYQGKPVSAIYKDGKCIYPGSIDLRGVLESFRLPSSSNAVSSIVWADNLPSGITYTISRSVPHTDGSGVYSTLNELIELPAYYNNHTTYNIGDMVLNNAYLYTCLFPIHQPEIFNPNHWVQGIYPKILGMYSSAATYKIGDVVFTEYGSTIAPFTCIYNITSPEEYVSGHWVFGYRPELVEYQPLVHYSIGDTVVYNLTYYTCLVDHISTDTFNSNYWFNAYYPGLSGSYIYSNTYYLGDTVRYNNKIYTCKSVNPIQGIIPTNTTYWVNAYSPYIKYSTGAWDAGKQYHIGDISGISTVSIYTWPNIPYDPAEYKIYAWLDNSNIYLYCKSKNVRTSRYYRLSADTSSGLSGITDISALSTWNTSHTIELSECFSKLISLSDFSPVSNWNVSNVANFKQCFKNCQALQDLTQFRSWNTSSATTFLEMFNNCTSIKSLDGLQYWNTTNVYDMSGIFYNCTDLTDISALSTWRTDGLLYLEYNYANTIYSAFRYCTSLTSLHGLENWNVSKVTELAFIFNGCTSLSDISALTNWDISNVTTLSEAFTNCTSLTNVDALSLWNTSNVTDLMGTFEDCSSLADISGLQNWDISSVTHLGYLDSRNNRHGMFRNCTSLTSLYPIANWDTSSVKSIVGICENNTSLTRLYGLHWDLTECTSYGYAFYNCTSITEIKELYWTNIRTSFGSGCFENCDSLVVADLSKCTATEPTGYGGGAYLFNNCSNLERCDLGTIITSSSFGIWGATNADFGHCTKLSLVIIRNTNKVFTRAYYYGYGDGLENLVNNNGKVYVPQALLADYLASNAWIDLTQRGVEILALEGSPYEQPGSI